VRRDKIKLTRINFPVPTTAQDLVQRFERAITPQTKVLHFCHITNLSGQLFPVQQLSRLARQRGILTIVDGAHAVAQLDLDLETLGADFYAGNCHKWLCAPKGAGFVHVRTEWQERVDGPIVSWGYDEPATFISRTERQGTRDAAAYLAVPEAIAFQREHDVRERCVELAREARRELCALLGTEPLAPDASIRQMASVRLPHADPELSRRLFDEHRIEIPTMGPRRDDLLRISVAAYTEREDVERLLDALPAALRSARSPG